MSNQKNVFNRPLQLCGMAPLTGYKRNGMCEYLQEDGGAHIVCAIISDDFLQFTKRQGNDLITPTNYFPGLKAGDKWCICALRWLEAYRHGYAPLIDAEATNIQSLKFIEKELRKLHYIS